MRKTDAPPPGWYPDPTGGSRLWWWDGLDWTDARAAPPNPSVDVPTPTTAGDQAPDPAERGRQAARQAVGSSPSSALGRQATQDVMAEVRKVARSEVDRATDAFRQQVGDAQRRIEPLISQYSGQVVRWVKIAVIAAVVLLILWFVLQIATQATLMDWFGDRVDNLFDGTATTTGVPW